MTAPKTLPAGYFDAMYQTAADPWGFEDRWYERRKYAISLAMLPAARYRRAFEPACSVGVLTQMLAGRCDELLACDVAEAAVGVVVPAHNEETLLPACLSALRRAVNIVGIPAQVLVVADTCTDQTAATARAGRV